MQSQTIEMGCPSYLITKAYSPLIYLQFTKLLRSKYRSTKKLWMGQSWRFPKAIKFFLFILSLLWSLSVFGGKFICFGREISWGGIIVIYRKKDGGNSSLGDFTSAGSSLTWISHGFLSVKFSWFFFFHIIPCIVRIIALKLKWFGKEFVKHNNNNNKR